MKPVRRNLLFCLLAVFATGCDQFGIGDEDAEPTGTATSISEVHTVFVSANDCTAGIRNGLGERGFGAVGTAADADGVLTVTIEDRGRNMDQIPEFGGFGSKAGYSASLTGAEGKSLFATSGDEGSVTHKEMCQDIGDEIGERLRAARGG